jgi:hypothetical protein
MSFGGGGSGALPNHEHTGIPLDGGPLDFVNTTIASLSANSMTYSSGAALQELPIGSDAQVLAVSGGAPTWITNTSNPLVKVTKTFADIVVGTTSMDIYTLPEDSALVNVWADITTAFDVSTGPTIGDGSDDNGFAEATDWTAGTGLTDATRGAYITSFKTMRSTSGTTAIKAYNFSTTGGAGTTFSQLLTNDSRGLSNSPRQEMAQQFNAGHVLVGQDICHASFFINNDSGSPTGTLRSFIRQSDGTLIQESSTTLDASTLTGSFVEYSFAFPDVTLSAGDMITISAAGITNSTAITVNTTEMINGKLYDTSTTGSGYSQMTTQQMQMTVTYACAPVTSDTVGAVDFYLQVVN